MEETVTTVIRGARPDDWEQIAHLNARCFMQEMPLDDELRAIYEHYTTQRPGFDHAHERIAVRGGQVVSHTLVIPYTMRYGGSTLKVGGIGNVCTHPDHRRRGYAGEVLQDTIPYMNSIGCDLSLLNGVGDYYNRFGYANVWPMYLLRMDARNVAGLSTSLTVRDLTDGDIPAMLALYNRTWRDRPGAWLRDAEYLTWKLWDVKARRLAAVDRNGRVRGYLAGMGPWQHPAWSGEVLSADPDATAALLRASAAEVEKAGGEDHTGERFFYWITPPDDPPARHVRDLCPVDMVAWTRPNGGWMGRIINLQSTVEKLFPELEARLADSQFTGWSGRLRLETDLGQITLAFSQGKPALGRHTRSSLVAQVDQANLIQLMFAYATPEEVAARQGVQIDPEAIPLLRALFPQRVCCLAGLDWY